MARRHLDEPVLQSAQDALIGEVAGGETLEPAAPRGEGWRAATGRHPLGASLLALAAGALAAAWLKSALSRRREPALPAARRFRSRA